MGVLLRKCLTNSINLVWNVQKGLSKNRTFSVRTEEIEAERNERTLGRANCVQKLLGNLVLSRNSKMLDPGEKAGFGAC
jgi:hypothetical protein